MDALPFDLARVPGHWSVAPLGTHFNERKTQVSDTAYAPLSVTKDGVVPQLESAAKTDNNDSRRLVRAGDFVINSRSDRKGSSGLAALDGSVSPVYTVLTPRGSIDPWFAHHLLRSRPFQEEFYRWGVGIVDDLWTTRYSAMKRIPLPLPPIDEQRRIARFLDRETAQIDALIAKQQQFIGLLQERRRAELASELGGLDAKDTELRRVAVIQTGVTLSGAGDPDAPEWPYLRVANVQMGFVDLTTITTIRLSVSEARASMLRAGDVLMTEGGDIDKLGRGTVWSGEIDPMLHQNHIFAVRPNRELAPAYLALWLDAPPAREHFYVTAKKTTNLASTNKTLVGRMPLRLPSPEVQREFVFRINAKMARIDSLIAKATEHIALAQERRAALIAEAVTGRIDVSLGRAA